MWNDRLFHLALMSIDADNLREINFKDLVTEFAKKKARKVSLYFEMTSRPFVLRL